MKKAVAIAESRGFKLVHGIVDSMWLTKPSATNHDYKDVCEEVKTELGLPISFDGRYKWIVFLNSRVNPRIPVLNRYYGVLEDGTLKVRGIDLRRHDTPEIVRKCQNEMLTILSEARNSSEFRALIPKTLSVMKSHVSTLRTGGVPIEHLVVEKRLSKNPGEYTNQVPQAIAASHLVKEGKDIHAGQNISYVITRNKSKIPENRSMPAELIESTTSYDSESYVDLVISSAMNLLLPFGYNAKMLREAAY